MLSDKSKSLLVDKFIRTSAFMQKDLQNLSVQGNIFLIRALEQFEQNEIVKKRIELFEDNLILSISKLRVLYVLYDKSTNYPFYNDGCIEVFSNREGANAALAYYNEKMHRNLYLEGVPHKNFSFLFGDLYRLGLKNILIDKGQFSYKFKRESLVKEPDISDLTMIPETMEACIEFVQEMCWKVEYSNKEQKVDALEEEMFHRLAICQFLVPIHKDSKKILCARMRENEQSYIPIYSDWVEFERAYNPSEYDGMMMTLDDCVIIIRDNKYDGVILNSATMNFKLSNNILEEAITF